MNKDFTIIFEKMNEQAQLAEPEPQGGLLLLSGDSFVELDELGELRRMVAEVTEPEPHCFTTA